MYSKKHYTRVHGKGTNNPRHVLTMKGMTWSVNIWIPTLNKNQTAVATLVTSTGQNKQKNVNKKEFYYNILLMLVGTEAFIRAKRNMGSCRYIQGQNSN